MTGGETFAIVVSGLGLAGAIALYFWITRLQRRAGAAEVKAAIADQEVAHVQDQERLEHESVDQLDADLRNALRPPRSS